MPHLPCQYSKKKGANGNVNSKSQTSLRQAKRFSFAEAFRSTGGALDNQACFNSLAVEMQGRYVGKANITYTRCSAIANPESLRLAKTVHAAAELCQILLHALQHHPTRQDVQSYANNEPSAFAIIPAVKHCQQSAPN